MKSKLLLAIFITIGINFTAIAQNRHNQNSYNNGNYNQNSTLTLSTNQNGSYLFKVNGQTYKTYNSTVFLPEIQLGNHRLVILKWKSNRGQQGVWQTVYQGNINIPSNSKVDVNWDNQNGLSYQVTNIKVKKGPNLPNECQNTPNTNYNTTDYSKGMNPSTFQLFLQQLRDASFESSKLTFAKTGIKNHGINVQQLRQVLREFSFDSSRLDLAKYAHPFTVDQKNYFLLHDSFDFESNAQDLMSSI